jgi:pyruvate formate lyase activating enzyme
MAEAIPVAGFERLSAVDWEGKLSAVVFLQGCGWRCPYCHNPAMIPMRSPPPGAAPTWPEIRDWLHRRLGLLDAVVFSGGEPTLHPGLAEAMSEAKSLGFQTGLHTGAPDPEALRKLIPCLDWVGLDFKAPFQVYSRVTGRVCGMEVERGFHLLFEAGLPLEIRTTWHPALLSEQDLTGMAAWLHEQGTREWVLQRFRPQGCRSTRLKEAPLPADPPCFPVPDGLSIRWR